MSFRYRRNSCVSNLFNAAGFADGTLAGYQALVSLSAPFYYFGEMLSRIYPGHLMIGARVLHIP